MRALTARFAVAAAALGSVAVFTAAPAAADDQMYLDALDMLAVPVTDPAAAVAMGHAVCAGFDRGQTVHQVAADIAAAHALDDVQSGMVVGVSVGAYCDQYRALIGG